LPRKPNPDVERGFLFFSAPTAGGNPMKKDRSLEARPFDYFHKLSDALPLEFASGHGGNEMIALRRGIE
jgi:hypothetical protein